MIVFFAILQKLFAAAFGILDSCNQLAAIRRFRAARIIFRTQLPKRCLDFFPVVVSGVILLMQDQPKFETWIGAGNADAAPFAKRYSFIESRMIVSVEHSPDLVVFLKRFPAASTPRSLGKFSGLFRDGVGNAHAGAGSHLNESA